MTIEELRIRAEKAQKKADEARKLLEDREKTERDKRNKILDHFKFTFGGIALARARKQAEENDGLPFEKVFNVVYDYINSNDKLIREQDKKALRDGLDIIEAEIKATRDEKKKAAEEAKKAEAPQKNA